MITTDNNLLIFQCPHCFNWIEVYINEINCQIFRHGILKTTLQQINPHSTEQQCNEYVSKDLIYGCSRPFKLSQINTNTYKVDICDYM
jgi:hypothetical protein